jgi:hypothetical protein
LDFPADELDDLDAAENLRHIIVHNGSRVSPEYLTRTKRTDLRVGDRVQVTSGYAQDVSWMVSGLSTALFTAISIKYFGASRAEITGMLVRRDESD